MQRYIGTGVQQFLAKAKQMPSASELKAALHALTQSPMPGYSAFTTTEVSALAAYRCQFQAGIHDSIWQSITQNRPEAWMFAIHEAAELEFFLTKGIDALDPVQWRRHLPDAHLQATIAEDRFLKSWADHLRYTTTELALEIHNPIRKQFPGHTAHFQSVQLLTGWYWPNTAEEQEAQRFYQRILP